MAPGLKPFRRCCCAKIQAALFKHSDYLPSAGGDSITFQAADQDKETDITGSLVFTAEAGGEFVKPLHLPHDFLLSKVHICFAAGNTPEGPVTVKIYQGSPDPMAAVQTKVLFQQDIAPTPPETTLPACSEVLVLDPAEPTSIIDPSKGPLFLGIGFTAADSPVYLKAVGVQEGLDSFKIGDCDTGVVDRLVNGHDGPIMLSALIAQCEEGPPRNHGQYVRCVAHTLNALKKSHQITGREKGRILRCAAKSDIGK